MSHYVSTMTYPPTKWNKKPKLSHENSSYLYRILLAIAQPECNPSNVKTMNVNKNVEIEMDLLYFMAGFIQDYF